MKVLGVDPGIRGGFANVELNNGAAPQLVDAIDITVAGVGAKERVDAIAIRAWIETHRPQHEIPLTIIESAKWKKCNHLHGGDKEGGRQRALQLFPAAHALLARKKDHGRAEATLIALSDKRFGGAP
jgi:hypothetical protein